MKTVSGPLQTLLQSSQQFYMAEVLTITLPNGINVTLYGSGADGDVVISVNTILAGDAQYHNLTVNAGITLDTGGHVIQCSGTLLNNGTITNKTTAGSALYGGDGGLGGDAEGFFVLGPTYVYATGGLGGLGGLGGVNGGPVMIYAYILNNLGVIHSNGSNGIPGSPGGPGVLSDGNIVCSGGGGGGGGGDGGSGGNVVVYYVTLTNLGTVTANAGLGAAPGSGGASAGPNSGWQGVYAAPGNIGNYHGGGGGAGAWINGASSTAGSAGVNGLNGSAGMVTTQLKANPASFTGSALYYTTLDTDVIWNGHTYSSSGLLLKRSKITQVRGLEVDELDIEVYPTTAQIGGIGFLAACRNGAMDGAAIKLERVFYPSWGQTATGGYTLFTGVVSNIELGRTHAKLTVLSYLEYLQVQWPAMLYMPQCVWQLFNPGCGLSRGIWAVSGAVVAGTLGINSFSTNLTNVDDYFDLGVIIFTSGNNSGVSRTIKSFQHTNGIVNTILPLPNLPVATDAFQIYPGCDHQLTTCTNKFNNAAKYRGFQYIPSPETMY